MTIHTMFRFFRIVSFHENLYRHVDHLIYGAFAVNAKVWKPLQNVFAAKTIGITEMTSAGSVNCIITHPWSHVNCTHRGALEIGYNTYFQYYDKKILMHAATS